MNGCPVIRRRVRSFDGEAKRFIRRCLCPTNLPRRRELVLVSENRTILFLTHSGVIPHLEKPLPLDGRTVCCSACTWPNSYTHTPQDFNPWCIRDSSTYDAPFYNDLGLYLKGLLAKWVPDSRRPQPNGGQSTTLEGRTAGTLAVVTLLKNI